MKVQFLRLSYFVWVPVLAGLYGFHAAYGLPHAIWSYTYHMVGSTDRWDYGARRYSSCTYVGPYGVFTRGAVNGRCGWFAFFRKNDKGVQ